MTRDRHRDLVVLAKRIYKSKYCEDRLEFSIEDFQKIYHLDFAEAVVIQWHLHTVLNNELKFLPF